MEFKQKWIMYDDSINLNIRIGRPNFHKNLLPPDQSKVKVYGGGLWAMNKEKTVLHLYGLSFDFGPVTDLELFKKDFWLQTAKEQELSIMFSQTVDYRGDNPVEEITDWIKIK